MIKLLLRELRLVAGHTLQTVATRMLATPAGLRRLEGDQLTRVARSYGCDRETDAQLRGRTKAIAQGLADDDEAQYREPSK